MHRITLALLLTCLLVSAARGEEAAEPGVPEETTTLESLRADVDSILGKLDLQFYGHFRLDTAYDTQRTNSGNTAAFVKPEAGGDTDDEFNMTARHTRLGLNYTAPESWGPKATAKLEFDFYGDGSENAPGIRMRHAFLSLDLGDGFSLLAGQTWDLFGPLHQLKLNTNVGWFQGNVAFRRPMIRVGKKTPIGEGSSVLVEAAIARPIGIDADKDTNDDGEDAGRPDLQGRIGFSVPLFDDAPPTVIGFGGMYGWRETDFGSGDDDYTSWIVCLDVKVPVTKTLEIRGEVFTGQALKFYKGGISQDYNSSLREAIASEGAFLNVIYKPHKQWMIVVGAGMDDPDDDDLSSGDRSRNTSFFGNVRYKITKEVFVGLEVDRMTTDYRGADDASTTRVQVTFMLKW